MCHFVEKYNVPGPRYTSYPTVPYWDLDSFSGKAWKQRVQNVFLQSQNEGIGLYIHLPFCESMCTFCGCHKRITKRHEVELPYIQSVLKEWRLYVELLDKKPTIKELHLGGGTPTFFSPENLELLIKGILFYAEKAENPHFSFEGHPNNTSKAHLRTLYNLGFRRVCFGVQDYSEKVQRAINRVQAFEHVVQVTNWAREIGYTSVGHDIIYGLPFQRKDDVRFTIEKTLEIRPDRIAFYSYAHVPWRKGNGQRGYRDEDLPNTLEKDEQRRLGKRLLLEAGYEEVGMDHFALGQDALTQAKNQGKLHRSFMGYTENRTALQLGLGVSSIGDSGNAFAQNVKSLEEYQNLLSHDILPLSKGHLLNREDGIIRKHILQLMCQFETTWDDDIKSLENYPQILEHLCMLEADGLVTLNGKGLKVTATGTAFIRNICMAFDLRLQQKSLERRLFSMTV
ncbi:MAG: oxygen-independent coproporphyrinogen III oxidase [Bacteroidota bacterium]